MTVTAIEPQKHNKDKLSVFIDGEFAFGLYKDDIIYFKLKEGEEVPQEKFDFITENLVYIKAQDSALNFLSYKARTEKEVRDKLKEKEYSEEISGRVIDFLIKYSYINDEKYCRMYISESTRLKQKGKFLIKMELLAKGIDEKTISFVMEDTEIDEVSGAVILINKKIKGFNDLTDKKRQSIYGMLQRKGYSYDVIKDAMEIAKNTSDNIDE